MHISFTCSLSALKRRLANKAMGLNPAHLAGSTLPYPRVKQELNEMEESRPLSLSLPLPFPSSTDNQLVHEDSDERTAQYIRSPSTESIALQKKYLKSFIASPKNGIYVYI
jgi:hypothetical protein